MFALVDCNNFFASCERLFRPDLQQRALVVLSNNDGCVIARSNEAKALGISMGEPYFKIKSLCHSKAVAVFSSNFSLYGDISQRIMSSLLTAWPEVEIYSIDEAFLDLSSLPAEKQLGFCQQLQQQILHDIGMPVSIGLGKSKTLAKIANHLAKKHLKTPVVQTETASKWLDKIPVQEIWGVGRKLGSQLPALGIYTAGDLARANPQWIRKRFSVVLQSTVYELNGLSCISLETLTTKKSILSSRSFGSLQTELASLNEAVSSHVARAWEKLRQQESKASYLSVFVQSNRFRQDLPQYANSTGFRLTSPSDDIRQLTHYAKLALKQIFKEQVYYNKVGVLLDDLTPKQSRQFDLFDRNSDKELILTEKLMQTIGHINQRYGSSTLRLAAEGYCKPWAMKRSMKSPSYTTGWNELPLVRIG